MNTTRMHALLDAACGDRAPSHPLRDTRPHPPWLSPRSWGRAAIWMAEYALSPATEIERDVLDEAAQILGYRYERGAIDPAPRGTDQRLDLAESARKACEQVEQKLAQAVQYYAHVVASTAPTLVADPDRLVAALDDELFRLEAAELVASYDGPAEAIEDVLWRGEGQKNRLGRCIVRTAESYGIVIKLKGRYQWFAGGRDDVLATIPDAELDAAVKIVEACEARHRGVHTPSTRVLRETPSTAAVQPTPRRGR